VAYLRWKALETSFFEFCMPSIDNVKEQKEGVVLNAMKFEYVDLTDTGIIDPCRADR
jgi:hypothetical protein